MISSTTRSNDHAAFLSVADWGLALRAKVIESIDCKYHTVEDLTVPSVVAAHVSKPLVLGHWAWSPTL